MTRRVEFDDSDTAGIWMQAVMYFPANPYLRKSFYAVELARGKSIDLSERDRLEITKGTLDLLISAPPAEELDSKAKGAIKQGAIVGDILSAVYLMHHFELSEPSKKKAIYCAQRYAEETLYGDDSVMPIGDRTLEKYWSKFKTVAHYWAAWRLYQTFESPEGDKSPFFDELPLLLNISAGLYEFGRNFVPARANPPRAILDAPDMWEPPSFAAPYYLEADEAPARLLAYLKDYEVAPD
jgi:hypothetical protein